jgi:hypothetical protein
MLNISVAQYRLERESDYQQFLSLARAESDSQLAPFRENPGMYLFVYFVLPFIHSLRRRQLFITYSV